MHIRKYFSTRIYCTHKNCRFGEVSFPTPVYKSSRISATQRPIRNKFGTNVEKGRLVRNPQKYFCRLMVPFRVDDHIYIYVCHASAHAQDNNNYYYLYIRAMGRHGFPGIFPAKVWVAAAFSCNGSARGICADAYI